MVLDRDWYDIEAHHCEGQDLKCSCGFIGIDWNEMEDHFNQMADIIITEQTKCDPS